MIFSQHLSKPGFWKAQYIFLQYIWQLDHRGRSNLSEGLESRTKYIPTVSFGIVSSSAVSPILKIKQIIYPVCTNIMCNNFVIYGFVHLKNNSILHHNSVLPYNFWLTPVITKIVLVFNHTKKVSRKYFEIFHYKQIIG